MSNFLFNTQTKSHLLLHTVSSIHVFDVIEEITNWVHVAEMLAVLVDCLQHLIEGHTNLKHTGMSMSNLRLRGNLSCKIITVMSYLKDQWSNLCVYLQHASRPLLLEALQERSNQVIHVEQLELCLDDGLQSFWKESINTNTEIYDVRVSWNYRCDKKVLKGPQEQEKRETQAILTWESERAARWMSDARQRELMPARNCSSSRCSSGGRLWNPARQRESPTTLSLMSGLESQSRTLCGRGERSSRAPDRKEWSWWTNVM